MIGTASTPVKRDFLGPLPVAPSVDHDVAMTARRCNTWSFS
jgi:hypothetical protein